MGLSILVVNYNGEKYIEPFIDSLYTAMEAYTANYEVLVYDNNSTDNSLKLLEKYRNLKSNFAVYSNNDNIGFARGNNFLVKKCRYENLMLINNDTKIVNIAHILEYLNKNGELNKDVISCRILNADFTIQQNVFTYPGILRLIIQLFLLKDMLKKIYRPKPVAENTANQYYSGCFLVLGKVVYQQVGGFDEDYFFYHEEADLFLKFEQHKIRKMYFDNSKIIHYGGGGGAITEFSFLNYFFSLFILYKKHYFRKNPFILLLLFKIAFTFRKALVYFKIPFNPSPFGSIYKEQSIKNTNFPFLKSIHQKTISKISEYYEAINNNGML